MTVTVSVLVVCVVGTGKTATVLASIEALQRQEVEKGTLEDFDFLEINCLRLQSPQEACKIHTTRWEAVNGYFL